jgi:uncharacterized protein (TIGR02145 family)
MKKIKTIIVVTGAAVLLFFCGSTVFSQTIKAGEQTWTTQNLDVNHFRNGEVIPEAKTKAEWQKAGEQKKPAWCYYAFDSSNGTKYGKLYNWYAVKDARGLAPKGWHIPSDKEWTVLTNYLGGENGAGAKMKNVSGWNDNGNANNSNGFGGLPGGLCFGDGSFYGVGVNGNWWSSSAFIEEDVWSRNLYSKLGNVNRNHVPKENGFSVRCVKD